LLKNGSPVGKSVDRRSTMFARIIAIQPIAGYCKHTTKVDDHSPTTYFGSQLRLHPSQAVGSFSRESKNRTDEQE
jgi:hypothetical protein